MPGLGLSPLRFDQLAWGPTSGPSGTWAPGAGLTWMSPLCSMPVDGANPDDGEAGLEAEVARLVDSPPVSPRGPTRANVGVVGSAPELHPARTQRFEWIVPSTKLRSKDKVAVSRVLETAQGNFKMLLTPRGENFAMARQGTLQLKCLDPPAAAVTFRFRAAETQVTCSHQFVSCAVSPAVLFDLPALRPADVGLPVSVELL